MNATATLPEFITTLQQTPPPPGGVLSVYLDTGPSRGAGQAYLLAFRDGCKALRSTLPSADSRAFEAAVRRAERYLVEQVVPGKPGLTMFASDQEAYFHALPLPKAPTDEVWWDSVPLLSPLQLLLEEDARLSVLLFDKQRARLLTIVLGAVEEERRLFDDVPGKQATGGWYALSQARYARHHEEHVLRHVKRTTAALLDLLRTRPFDRLLLGGPDEALALLKSHLPPPLRARLAGTLSLELSAGDTEVLQAAMREAALLARQEQERAVQDLLEAAGTPHAVVGLDATLAALNERRVHRLLVAEGFALAGAECPRCGRLCTRATLCPVCDAPMTPVPNLETHLAAQAHEQGATLEVVCGAASERLMACNGVGAWTHY